MSNAKHPYRSIAEFQEAISSGKTTVKTVTEHYMEAIKDLDPDINAFTFVNQKALEDAAKLDVSPTAFKMVSLRNSAASSAECRA